MVVRRQRVKFNNSCSVYEIMYDNIENPDRPQMTLWCKSVEVRSKHSNRNVTQIFSQEKFTFYDIAVSKITFIPRIS